ncbi:ACP S-malonyltransferase [Fervidobacterium thailandense]|uniref:Malonyl CoA-acyl carrier protein transacylase n=1 Tax=Fervidobacterium thailandense TaxID=1008305 RepID=A0A1E3G0C9_9BACT|nr:ACP S-malonyltransferase [Fervidobacterium thailandense]ODN29677.1 malonyl CoA-acyl carrier protein transacylase [Fervidobacterium thailandense]
MRAFIFPGQGSQYSGMATDFSKYKPWNEYLERAKSVLKFDIDRVMDGDEETLKLTENAQPAIFLASYVAYEQLRELGVDFDAVAGHSLGEYTALAVAGVYDFETGIYLVRKRGEYISQAVKPGEGSMAAVLGADLSMVEEEVKKFEELYVANYNSADQVVVSGKTESVKQFVEEMRKKKIKAIELKVSGPFHTPLLDEAKERMTKEIEHIKFRTPKVPIVMNSTARETTDPETIKHYVLEQISGPVLWYQSVNRMLELGVKEFVEVGPKNVLSSMLVKAGHPARHFMELLNEIGSEELEKVAG